MKKVLSCILISTAIILLVFSLCACSGEDDEIIGEWTWTPHYAEAPDSSYAFSEIKFNSDKTISGIVRKDGKSMETWTWSSGKKSKCYNIENEEFDVWSAQILPDGVLLITIKSIREDGTVSNCWDYHFTKKS